MWAQLYDIPLYSVPLKADWTIDVQAMCGCRNAVFANPNAPTGCVMSLEEIEQMEKEGARFMDIKKTDIRKKRRTGAIIGAVVMILFMGFVIGLMLWANTQDPIPTGLLIFLIAIPVVIIGGILAALAGRMKEIEGGEEDEASKY